MSQLLNSDSRRDSRPLGENQWRLVVSTHARSYFDQLNDNHDCSVITWALILTMTLPEALRLYRAILRRASHLRYTDRSYFQSLVRREFENGRKINTESDTKFQIQVTCG